MKKTREEIVGLGCFFIVATLLLLLWRLHVIPTSPLDAVDLFCALCVGLVLTAGAETFYSLFKKGT